MDKNTAETTVLVVDDDPNTLEVLQRNLTDQGFRIFSAKSVQEALGILETAPIDLVITDYKMPKVTGLDLIKHVRENYKDIEVMMITGFATIQGAVEAIKSGAEEYLTKPFTSQELLDAVQRSLEKLQIRRAGMEEARIIYKSPSGILGKSPRMVKVFDAIEKSAKTFATVLITGESGTGKELVARAIHYSSKRVSAPFVPINCGGIPETLLESELFGYVKGAFTGATESRAGFFQTADGGTIFLDEISETSLAMQVKLLRVLQDKEVAMIGASIPRKVDVRIIAATNKDLYSLVEKGSFREDLFFRINVITIEIPPLRDRGDDILYLTRHFVEKYSEEMGKKPPRFSDEALQVLKSYYFPGNIRELQNVIQRIVVMSDSDLIEVPDLPSLMRFSALRKTGFDRTLAEVETEHIKNVLANLDGNKSKAAEILGIDRKTLRKKLQPEK
jgi:DNA-binding NtrC family response regulator